MPTKPKATASAARKRAIKALLAENPIMAELHRRAEAELRRKDKEQARQRPRENFPDSEADSRRLLHEVQVHQVELELQNTELQEARGRMEDSLEQYSDLYDFAPIGYFTLAPDGVIQQVNLTGASLVGIDRSALVGQPFDWLLPVELRPVMRAFLKAAFSGPLHQTGDFELLGKKRPFRVVSIKAQRSADGRQCRVVVVDITERRQAEEKVRASEIRYRRLFEAAHDGVLLLDPATRKITDANPFMTELLGYPNEQLVGKELFEIGLLKDEGASQEMFRKLKLSHEVRYEDLPLESQSGRHQEVEVVANLYHEDGHPVIQCNIRDITERKLAEEKLRQSEERYHTLFRSMDQGYCIIEMIFDKQRKPVDWRFLEVNPSFERHNGLHNATGKLISELAPDLEASWFEIYGKVAQTGKPVRLEMEAKGLEGRWFDLYAFRVGGPEKRRVAVLFNNITARKNIEEELSEKARLLDLSHDAIIVRDVKGRIRYWNHGAEELYGWSSKEALGKVSHVLLKTQYPTPLKLITSELLRRNRWTGELVHTKRDGRRVNVLVRKTLDRDSKGNPASVLENITDITERKHGEETRHRLAVLHASNRKLEKEIVRRRGVEKSLRKSEGEQRRLLEEAQRMQGQLKLLSRQVLRVQEEERKRISRELHDVIAQTLTVINVRLDGLKKASAARTMGIDRDIARTQQLVEKSVDVVHQFARELRPAMLDDLGLVPALHSYVKTFSKRHHLRVHLKVFAGLDQLDPDRRTVLYRVAQEALGNVARHAQATVVKLAIEKVRDGIRMTIRDNGRSFRAGKHTDPRCSQRLGLLGMSERLEMVGGRFEVRAAPGVGTTIIALVPPPRGKSPSKRADRLPRRNPIIT